MCSLTWTFGLTRDVRPDEFTVVTRAPLSMPPDFTLRPPQPGAARPVEQSDRSLAESALVPAAASGRCAGWCQSRTGGVGARRGRGAGAPADIRQRGRPGKPGSSTLTMVSSTKLLHWRKPDTVAACRRGLPPKEAQRLRQDSALGQSPQVGDTPVIREKKKGWFQDLFSWL